MITLDEADFAIISRGTLRTYLMDAEIIGVDASWIDVSARKRRQEDWRSFILYAPPDSSISTVNLLL